MNTLAEFSQQIHRFIGDKKFTEALSLFKSNKVKFNTNELASNLYLMADILTCLRNTDSFTAAYKFMEIYGFRLNDETPERILTAYTLVLYDHYKYASKATERHLINGDELNAKIEVALVFLQKKKGDFSQNLLNLFCKLLFKTETNKSAVNWKFLAAICERIDPGNLSTENYTIQVKKKGQLKDTELASVKEDWYAVYTKALYMTHQYERCIELSKAAFEQLPKMHYSNELWFSRRIALCMKHQGDIQGAIKGINKLILRNRVWYMIKELAELYHETGDNTKALELAKEAMILPGEFNFKVGLIEFLGDILTITGELRYGFLHYLMAKEIRNIESWPIEHKLIKKINAYQGNQMIEIASLRPLLEQFWKPHHLLKSDRGKANIPKMETQTGRITKIMSPKETGVDGTALGDNGVSVYFFLKTDHPDFSNFVVGRRICYKVLPTTDPKKLPKAIHLNLIH